MNNSKNIKEIIKEIKPKIIIQAAVPISPETILKDAKIRIKKFGLLDPAIISGIYAHILPICLVFTINLLKVIRNLDIDPIVFNMPNPDTANLVLTKAKLGSPFSAGTIDLTVFGICKAISIFYNIPIEEIEVMHISHHALRVTSIGKVPFFLKASRNGTLLDISKDIKKILSRAIEITTGHDIAWMVGASTAKHVKALLSPNQIYSHMPGFRDIPGGIPVIIGNGKIKQNLPDGLSLNKVREINNKGMYIDGIEAVEADGSVKFNKYAVRYLKEVLGLKWNGFNLMQIHHICNDLLAIYRK